MSQIHRNWNVDQIECDAEIKAKSKSAICERNRENDQFAVKDHTKTRANAKRRENV